MTFETSSFTTSSFVNSSFHDFSFHDCTFHDFILHDIHGPQPLLYAWQAHFAHKTFSYYHLLASLLERGCWSFVHAAEASFS